MENYLLRPIKSSIRTSSVQSLILTVLFRDGMILLDRSDKGKWGKIDLKLFALNESHLNLRYVL